MVKKKPKAKKKLKIKNYKLVIEYSCVKYRYITATSLKDAQQKWDNNSWEADEYDLDECGEMEDLVNIVEVK